MQKTVLRRGFKQMLAEANAIIQTVSVQDLPYLPDDPSVILVDVREAVEREAEGSIPGSVHAPRGLLEFQAGPESPMYNAALHPEKKLVIYCASGGRSALAAKTLLDMGFPNAISVVGGFAAWQAAENR